jgi:hypothetical protein
MWISEALHEASLNLMSPLWHHGSLEFEISQEQIIIIIGKFNVYVGIGANYVSCTCMCNLGHPTLLYQHSTLFYIFIIYYYDILKKVQ